MAKALLPTLPEGGRSSSTVTARRRMTKTIELARFRVDDLVPALGLAWRIRPSWSFWYPRGVPKAPYNPDPPAYLGWVPAGLPSA